MKILISGHKINSLEDYKKFHKQSFIWYYNNTHNSTTNVDTQVIVKS